MQTLERNLVNLIAVDRIHKPISSMSGKLKRREPKLAKEIYLGKNNEYNGDRVYGRIVKEKNNKAKGMKEGIEEFTKKHPKYGEILRECIQEKRDEKETYLKFGMQDGCILNTRDYVEVLQNLGFSRGTAERLYPELKYISENLKKKKPEYRGSILIG